VQKARPLKRWSFKRNYCVLFFAQEMHRLPNRRHGRNGKSGNYVARENGKRVPSDLSGRRTALASALIFRTSVPGLSPGRRPEFPRLPSPLPATLAGGLPPSFPRGFRIRVVIRGISNGFGAAFRHRRSPPDLLLREPCRLPFGRPLGVLRVVPWSHAEPCGSTRASRFPWRSP